MAGGRGGAWARVAVRNAVRPARERVRNRSISCSRLDWERIRERAAAAGKPMSRYIVERALSAMPAAEPPASEPLVLTAQEQRGLLDTALRLEELLSGTAAPEGGGRPGLPAAAGFLFEAKLDDMLRTGRYREMRALLDRVAGEERAARIADEAYERRRRQHPS